MPEEVCIDRLEPLASVFKNNTLVARKTVLVDHFPDFEGQFQELAGLLVRHGW